MTPSPRSSVSSVPPPGDVTLPLWSHGKGLAVDVAVTSPFSAFGMRAESPADAYALTYKHGKYDEGFRGAQHDFLPLVLETTGGVGSEGREFLRQVFRFVSNRWGLEHSVFAGRAWARLTLQSSVAQAVLNRVPGVGFLGGVVAAHPSGCGQVALPPLPNPPVVPPSSGLLLTLLLPLPRLLLLLLLL